MYDVQHHYRWHEIDLLATENKINQFQARYKNSDPMSDLQEEFEATGSASWINSDLYPNGKIYTKEYTEWLEKQVEELRIKAYVCECDFPLVRTGHNGGYYCGICKKDIKD